MTDKPIYFIIVAAGSGSRFGADLPKQFCRLAGRPVLCHAIERARKAIPAAHIITVISTPMVPLWRELAKKDEIELPSIAPGGQTRWESVKNALSTIATEDPEAIVLVHDAARPLLDVATAQAVVDAIEPGVSAVPVVPVTDSLRHILPDGTSEAVDRSEYRAVVTPQGFMLSDLRHAYSLPYSPSFTDDASVMAAAGMPRANLVPASHTLIKITNPGDLSLAKYLL